MFPTFNLQLRFIAIAQDNQKQAALPLPPSVYRVQILEYSTGVSQFTYLLVATFIYRRLF